MKSLQPRGSPSFIRTSLLFLYTSQTLQNKCPSDDQICNHLLKALLLLQPLFLRLSLLLLIVPHGRLRQPLVLPDLPLDGVDQLGALDGAEQHHLVGVVDQGEAAQLPALAEHPAELSISHSVPDELDVTNHEVLNEKVVHT